MRDADSTGPAEAGRRPRVVFFVDDDPGMRQLVSKMLKKRGYEVILAASAREASEVIESHDGEIDVLLMDIVLPDGWGATVAHRLRQVRPNMAVVYTTGFAKGDPVLSSGLGSADFVVTKPFTAEQLGSELERAISSNS